MLIVFRFFVLKLYHRKSTILHKLKDKRNHLRHLKWKKKAFWWKLKYRESSCLESGKALLTPDRSSFLKRSDSFVRSKKCLLFEILLDVYKLCDFQLRLKSFSDFSLQRYQVQVLQTFCWTANQILCPLKTQNDQIEVVFDEPFWEKLLMKGSSFLLQKMFE